MKKLILAAILLLTLAWQAAGQTFTSERKLHLKTLDQNNVDSYITWTGNLSKNDSKVSFMVGYGQTLVGNGFFQAQNSWGKVPFGSGLAHSPLYNIFMAAGPEYTQGINTLGWGSNGLGLSINGTFKNFTLGGAYSGYNGLASFQFNGTIGTFTGRGLIVVKENKVDQLRTDLEVKF